MKMLYILLFGILLGLVRGDIECLNLKKAECEKEAWEEITKEGKYDFCSTKPKLLKCLETASIKCNKILLEDAKKIATVTEKVCKEGSKFNKDLQKHQPCLEKMAVDSLECLKEITDKVKVDEDLTPFEILEIQKMTCLKLDDIMKCLNKKVKRSCGQDAYNFQRLLFDPEMVLQKEICKLILKDGCKATPLSSFLAPIMML